MKHLLLILFFSYSSSAIVNGKLVRKDSEIAKFAISWTYNQSSFCSGVILSDRFILSAAHCVGGKNQVKFGIDNPQFIDVEEIIVHPFYRPSLLSWEYPNKSVNDLALLKLKESIPSGFRAVRIYSEINEPGDVLLIGTGKDQPNGEMGHMRYKKVSIIDYLVQSGEWVVSQGACGGDSGGPLVYQKANQYILLGITSRSDKRSNLGCFGPSINTDLIHQRAWIKSIIK